MQHSDRREGGEGADTRPPWAVVAFVGFCFEPVVALIIEYCARGSLHDVLRDENQPMTWTDYKLTLLHDVARACW